jgi:hypothetical protein
MQTIDSMHVTSFLGIRAMGRMWQKLPLHGNFSVEIHSIEGFYRIFMPNGNTGFTGRKIQPVCEP